MKTTTFLLLLTTFLTGTKAQSISDYRSLFEYDKGLSLFGKVLSVSDSFQETIQNIVFTSVNGVQVTGTLILPKQKIKEFPVVIFMPDMLQSKSVFFSQALDLASEAVASLLIDSPTDRPDDNKYTFHNFTEPRKDFSAYRQSAFDVRRAIDFLEDHDRIDQNRIAFVGSGTGAMTGAIVAGVENRICSYILINNYFCFMSELKYSNQPSIVKARELLEPDQEILYESMLKPLDPKNYLPYHRNSYIFFQFNNSDNVSAKDALQVTKEPKKQKFYKANGISLVTFDEAAKDRKNWLTDHL